MQAYAVLFTHPAVSDLEDIRRYIAWDDVHAAGRVSAALVAACDTLERFPGRGGPGVVRGTRELVAVRPYVIVYRIEGRTVESVRVWHGARHR